MAEADAEGLTPLVLGGGSNLVVADRGYPGLVLKLNARGRRVTPDRDHVQVRVEAGHDWDELVAWAVAEDLAGIECLSGIPGRVGAAPMQNIGAYGQEVAESLVEVEAVELTSGSDLDSLGRKELELDEGVQRLIAVAEDYPDLKANENFLKLQEELAETEDQLQFARRKNT